MADDRVVFFEMPDLDEPVLVIALEGWIDAGFGAQAAVAALIELTEAEPIATFDGGRFIDQRARRPVARIVDGVTTSLTWPEIQLRHGTDEEGNDLLILTGPEPDFHWEEFCDLIVQTVDRLDVRMVVGFGAFPAPAPHTRPVRLAATVPASSAHMLGQVGLVAGELEVPAGISSALELAMGEEQVDMITLWARVPHYVATLPYPQASTALLEGLCDIAGLVIDTTTLRGAAEEARLRVDDLVGSNPEHANMVRDLERTIDEAEGNAFDAETIPTGDDLARDIEEFLRGEESS